MDHHDEVNFKEITKIINHNSVVVDVGAHVGNYCKFFLETLDDSGKVYALEVHPINFNRLRKKYNLSDNVVLLNRAASNIDGVEPVYHDGTRSHTHTTNIIGKNSNGEPIDNFKIGSVASIRLDTLLINETIIDLIKIDVEGAEIKVLEGLSKIYNRINNIIVECHFDDDWDRIKDLLINQYNFLCYDLSNKNNITINTDERAYQCLCKKK